MKRTQSASESPVTLTTFEVARLLGVSPPTVVNWVTSGLLEAYKTPGGHRRIRRESVADFAHARGFPLPAGWQSAEPAPPAPLPSRRVLVVDDEPDFCEMVRTFLSSRGGWEVEFALSGFAAGLTIARFKPAVVLMDLMMPGMDGFEVRKMMQQDGEMSQIPVVACTAWRDPDIERRVQREGFCASVQKPVRLDQLASVLDAAVLAGTSRGAPG